MAGHGGNPNHDPRTGKFTSSEGYNRANSTRGQRAIGHVKSVGRFGLNLAKGAATGAVEAVASGVAQELKDTAAALTAHAIVTYSPGLTAHGKRVAEAAVSGAKTGGGHVARGVVAGAKIASSLAQHVGRMAAHARSEHRGNPMHEMSKSDLKSTPRPSPLHMHDVGAATLKSRPVTNRDGTGTSKMTSGRKKR